MVTMADKDKSAKPEWAKFPLPVIGGLRGARSEIYKDLGRQVIEIELAGLKQMLERIDDEFVRACRKLQVKGKVIVMGVGKSGHVANKIAATMASTGTPAFFVHPAEAAHGDLGMVARDDVVLALSNSGKTPELLTLLPAIKAKKITLIAMTGNPESRLAKEADVHVNVAVDQEACPLELAPTTSTTAALAMGDALAVAIMRHKEFTEQGFATSHPGGALGKRLLLNVAALMHSGEQVPSVPGGATLKDALLEMTRKGLGMTAVVDAGSRLLGIFTDGDLRRALDGDVNLKATKIDGVMTREPKTAREDVMATAALALMKEHKISALVVVEGSQRVAGALTMHDLLRAGLS